MIDVLRENARQIFITVSCLQLSLALLIAIYSRMFRPRWGCLGGVAILLFLYVFVPLVVVIFTAI